MVAFAPTARTCRPDLPEILVPGELERLRVGECITVFAWEIDDADCRARLRRRTGTFRGWDTVHCFDWLLLDQGFEEPHQICTRAIHHIERE